MSNIHKTVGFSYGDLAAEMARVVAYRLHLQHGGQILDITDIGSGDVTDATYKSEVYQLNYSYIFDKESLVGIKLQCDQLQYLKDGLLVTVDKQIREMYREIMVLTRLIGECRKEDLLSDEAIAHDDNWNDSV